MYYIYLWLNTFTLLKQHFMLVIVDYNTDAYLCHIYTYTINSRVLTAPRVLPAPQLKRILQPFLGLKKSILVLLYSNKNLCITHILYRHVWYQMKDEFGSRTTRG